MRSLISTALLLALACGAASAYAPTVADLDAHSRAAGNDLSQAVWVGKNLFSTKWPAEVSQVSANAFDSHLILGIRVWGVKFHRPITRKEFVDEVTALVERAFTVAPKAEEVDLWTSVPIVVGKDVVVSGDLAKPTTKTVFSITVRRGEPAAQVAARAYGDGHGVFWDQDWAHDAFKR